MWLRNFVRYRDKLFCNRRNPDKKMRPLSGRMVPKGNRWLRALRQRFHLQKCGTISWRAMLKKTVHFGKSTFSCYYLNNKLAGYHRIEHRLHFPSHVGYSSGNLYWPRHWSPPYNVGVMIYISWRSVHFRLPFPLRVFECYTIYFPKTSDLINTDSLQMHSIEKASKVVDFCPHRFIKACI